MSEPERTHGAGEDIPGTPGPFPFGLIAFAFAGVSAMLAAMLFFAGGAAPVWPLCVFAAIGWAVFGVTALFHGQWKGPLLGLPVMIAPWIAMYVLIMRAFAPE
ncbi:hypothetical protein OF829_05715 [Sphingomonas sp. LB-2]|uniref:hypothetical protein n=1 Tax=Sphingomonas caeni TaxID=2984949 RepID=UPI002230616E|nr:hypothetical protein [Sphingomonas caeni]MCW3846728.1 hypothetical protein [Sphingomonas caeni]